MKNIYNRCLLSWSLYHSGYLIFHFLSTAEPFSLTCDLENKKIIGKAALNVVCICRGGLNVRIYIYNGAILTIVILRANRFSYRAKENQNKFYWNIFLIVPQQHDFGLLCKCFLFHCFLFCKSFLLQWTIFDQKSV